MMEAWSSDDLEADAVSVVPATDHTCRLSDAADALQQAPNASHDQGLCTQANGENQTGTPTTDVVPTLSEEIIPGGAGSSLDLTNERDRGLVRQTLKNRPKRWAGVTDEVKAAVVAGLSKALHTATVHIDNGVDPLDAAKVVASVGRTFEALEAQCQKDEHRAEDNDRLDNGQATQAIKLYGIGTPIDAV